MQSEISNIDYNIRLYSRISHNIALIRLDQNKQKLCQLFAMPWIYNLRDIIYDCVTEVTC